MTDRTGKVNILFLHPNAELYGSDRVLLNVLKSLDRSKFNPTVILSYEGPLVYEITKLAIPVRIINLGILRRKYLNFSGILSRAYHILTSFFHLLGLIRKNHIDLIYTNTCVVLVGGLVAKVCRRQHIWYVQEIIENPVWVWKIISFLVCTLSTQVVAVSQAVKRHLLGKGKFFEKKIKVVYNGIDFNKFTPAQNESKIRKEFNIPDEVLLVGMVGRITPKKGQDHFLLAAREVTRRLPEAKFMVVGGPDQDAEDYMNELRRQAEDLGLISKVIFTGFRRDVAAILAAFDIFLLPSLRPESLPTVVLEAMATGKPIVGYAHGGMPEIVEDGRSGFLVPPFSYRELAKKIVTLAQDSELRSKMGNAARRQIPRKFSQENFTAAINNLILSACQSQKTKWKD